MMEKKIEIMEGVSAEFKDNVLTIKGNKGELKRMFFSPYAKMEYHDGVVVVKSRDERRKSKALVGTWIAHVKNMIKGVTEGFEYKLKVHYSHFPMGVKLNGNVLEISNYLGEKNVRRIEVPDGLKVNVSKEEIVVEGVDKELAGQFSARVEQLCVPKGRDRRKFLDGIYLVKKG